MGSTNPQPSTRSFRADFLRDRLKRVLGVLAKSEKGLRKKVGEKEKALTKASKDIDTARKTYRDLLDKHQTLLGARRKALEECWHKLGSPNGSIFRGQFPIVAIHSSSPYASSPCFQSINVTSFPRFLQTLQAALKTRALGKSRSSGKKPSTSKSGKKPSTSKGTAKKAPLFTQDQLDELKTELAGARNARESNWSNLPLYRFWKVSGVRSGSPCFDLLSGVPSIVSDALWHARRASGAGHENPRKKPRFTEPLHVPPDTLVHAMLEQARRELVQSLETWKKKHEERWTKAVETEFSSDQERDASYPRRRLRPFFLEFFHAWISVQLAALESEVQRGLKAWIAPHEKSLEENRNAQTKQRKRTQELVDARRRLTGEKGALERRLAALKATEDAFRGTLERVQTLGEERAAAAKQVRARKRGAPTAEKVFAAMKTAVKQFYTTLKEDVIPEILTSVFNPKAADRCVYLRTLTSSALPGALEAFRWNIAVRSVYVDEIEPTPVDRDYRSWQGSQARLCLKLLLEAILDDLCPLFVEGAAQGKKVCGEETCYIEDGLRKAFSQVKKALACFEHPGRIAAALLDEDPETTTLRLGHLRMELSKIGVLADLLSLEPLQHPDLYARVADEVYLLASYQTRVRAYDRLLQRISAPSKGKPAGKKLAHGHHGTTSPVSSRHLKKGAAKAVRQPIPWPNPYYFVTEKGSIRSLFASKVLKAGWPPPELLFALGDPLDRAQVMLALAWRDDAHRLLEASKRGAPPSARPGYTTPDDFQRLHDNLRKHDLLRPLKGNPKDEEAFLAAFVCLVFILVMGRSTTYAGAFQRFVSILPRFLTGASAKRFDALKEKLKRHLERKLKDIQDAHRGSKHDQKSAQKVVAEATRSFLARGGSLDEKLVKASRLHKTKAPPVKTNFGSHLSTGTKGADGSMEEVSKGEVIGCGCAILLAGWSLTERFKKGLENWDARDGAETFIDLMTIAGSLEPFFVTVGAKGAVSKAGKTAVEGVAGFHNWARLAGVCNVVGDLGLLIVQLADALETYLEGNQVEVTKNLLLATGSLCFVVDGVLGLAAATSWTGVGPVIVMVLGFALGIGAYLYEWAHKKELERTKAFEGWFDTIGGFAPMGTDLCIWWFEPADLHCRLRESDALGTDDDVATFTIEKKQFTRYASARFVFPCWFVKIPWSDFKVGLTLEKELWSRIDLYLEISRSESFKLPWMSRCHTLSVGDRNGTPELTYSTAVTLSQLGHGGEDAWERWNVLAKKKGKLFEALDKASEVMPWLGVPAVLPAAVPLAAVLDKHLKKAKKR